MESCRTVDNSQEIFSSRGSVGSGVFKPVRVCLCDLERTILLASTKSFASLVFHVVGLFSVPERR